jgi:hypothetical protein
MVPSGGHVAECSGEDVDVVPVTPAIVSEESWGTEVDRQRNENWPAAPEVERKEPQAAEDHPRT